MFYEKIQNTWVIDGRTITLIVIICYLIFLLVSGNLHCCQTLIAHLAEQFKHHNHQYVASQILSEIYSIYRPTYLHSKLFWTCLQDIFFGFDFKLLYNIPCDLICFVFVCEHVKKIGFLTVLCLMLLGLLINPNLLIRLCEREGEHRSFQKS